MVSRGTRICVVGTPPLSVSHPRARGPGREQNAYTCPRVTKRFGAILAVPRTLFECFRHRSRGTFCRSRRAEVIRVVGTPPFQIGTKAVFLPGAEVEPPFSDREKTCSPPCRGGGGGCGPNHFLSLTVTDAVAVTVTKTVSKTVSAGACNCTYSRNYNSVCN